MGRAFKEAGPSTREVGDGQESTLEEETPVGGRTRSKRNAGPAKVSTDLRHMQGRSGRHFLQLCTLYDLVGC